MSTAGLAEVKIQHLDKLYIDGEWVTPSQSTQLELTSPITEEVIAHVAEAQAPDMDRAVLAARRAFDHGPWPGMSPTERAGYLEKFSAALRERELELGHTWTNQTGVLFRLAQGENGAGVRAAGIFDYYAQLASGFEFVERHTPSYGDGRALIVREPVGVVAAIVPWNAPLELACVKLAPALLAGCTIILKPSPEAPLEGYILAEIAEMAGLPPGVLNVVSADRQASEYLIRNPLVDKVSFTGSSAAGCKIASILGERMGRYTMELGGKSAAILLDDFDVNEAAQSIAGGICHLSGQVCAALTRVIVPGHRHDEVADAFSRVMKSLVPGDPYDSSSHLGPLAMKRQLDRVEGLVKQGIDAGATLLVGGRRPSGLNRGYYFEPTLFVNVDNAMAIAQEEIFGPVLCLIPAEDEADAIRIANETNYGLNGAIFTHDSDRAFEMARQIRAGNIAQSGFRLDLGVAFGGFKQSGVGREGGREGLLPYLEPKTVFLND